MSIFWIVVLSLVGLLHIIDIRRVLQTTHPPVLSALPNTMPLISILIPARNEAARIGTCLNGLALQSYRHFEVIVIDDHSTDGTAECAHRYHNNLPHLSVVPGTELPHNWTGKNWACWQAACLAQGEWLLFLDADVIPGPDLLHALILATPNSDMISFLPFMLLGTWPERLILPAFLEFLGALYPFSLVNRRSSRLAFAIGQCLMIHNQAYQAIGGHAAVRMSILEDMQLATRAKRAGLRLYVTEAPTLVAVRMYLGWHSLTEGLTKNAVAGARHAGPRVAFITAQRLIVGWLPLQLLLFGWLTHMQLSTDTLLALGVLLIAQILIAGWIVRKRFRINPAWGVLLPVGTLMYFFIAANGLIRLWLGIGVRWKGRVLEAKD